MRPFSGLTGWVGGLALASAPLAGWTQTPAGQIMVATGTVHVTDAKGGQRAIARGETLHTGERVVTGSGGLVQIKTVDGGYISVRPETEMVVESVKFAADAPKESSFVIGLIKGGFRSITGAIGKANPDGYEIRTATATIGIRGTDHEPMFIPPNAPKLPDAPPPGIYDKVNAGETFIRNELGLLAIKPGQVGFSPVVPKVAPAIVRVVPSFYRDEVKVNIPQGDAAAPTEAPPTADTSRLRPRIGAVRTVAPRALGEVMNPAATSTLAPAATVGGSALTGTLSTVSPTLSTSTLEPLPTAVSPTISTTLQPLTTTISPTTATTLQPLTTTLSPTVSTTLQPLTTTLNPTVTTTLQPLTTTISPSTTTTLQPLTTTISPILSTTKTLITK